MKPSLKASNTYLSTISKLMPDSLNVWIFSVWDKTAAIKMLNVLEDCTYSSLDSRYPAVTSLSRCMDASTEAAALDYIIWKGTENNLAPLSNAVQNNLKINDKVLPEKCEKKFAHFEPYGELLTSMPCVQYDNIKKI